MATQQKIETPSVDEIRAVVADMDPIRKRQLLARLRAEQETRRTGWLCKNPRCTGAPHSDMPVPHTRPNQRLPFKLGDGKIGALFMAGRGYGKTRVGAEGTRQRVNAGQASRVALIGRTAADVRDVMVEGESGLLSVFPRWERPEYFPSKRKIVFSNGAQAFCYSSDQPDLLRGPQHDLVWGDECSTWRKLRLVLANALFGLRLGTDPRAILTGTPRPTKDMRLLVNGKIAPIHIIRGTTYENLSNLAPVFQDLIIAQFEGTRTGRQELNGELLEDVEGALLSLDAFEWDGFRPDVPQTEITKVVVAVDPAVTAEAKSDHTGIAVCATDALKRHGYVLWSERLRVRPAEAMLRVAQLYDQFNANLVVGEVNNGGEYVKTVLHQQRRDVPFKMVHASVGKQARAEPVAALYQQCRVSHVGHPHIHAALEDEWTSWVPPGTKDSEGNDIETSESPDVMDAVVWGLTHLLITGQRREVAKARSVKA